MASIKKSPHVHHRHFCHFQLDTCQSCQLVKKHKRGLKRFFSTAKSLFSPIDFPRIFLPPWDRYHRTMSIVCQIGRKLARPFHFHHPSPTSNQHHCPLCHQDHHHPLGVAAQCALSVKLGESCPTHSLPSPLTTFYGSIFFLQLPQTQKKIWITTKFYVDLNQSTQWRIEDNRIEDIFQYKHSS